jgi:hypothetical protein
MTTIFRELIAASFNYSVGQQRTLTCLSQLDAQYGARYQNNGSDYMKMANHGARHMQGRVESPVGLE